MAFKFYADRWDDAATAATWRVTCGTTYCAEAALPLSRPAACSRGPGDQRSPDTGRLAWNPAGARLRCRRSPSGSRPKRDRQAACADRLSWRLAAKQPANRGWRRCRADGEGGVGELGRMRRGEWVLRSYLASLRGGLESAMRPLGGTLCFGKHNETLVLADT
jgi:hypothetical protein